MTTGVAKPGSRYDQTRLLFIAATMTRPVTQPKVCRSAQQFFATLHNSVKKNSPQRGPQADGPHLYAPGLVVNTTSKQNCPK